MSTSRERMETTDAEEGLQLTLPSTTLQKNKCQLECWNLMDGVVYCPFFPFYKHHASVKEKSFCIGDVLQGPIFQIVHSCWRSI